MGATEHTVQAAGPQPSGGAAVAGTERFDLLSGRVRSERAQRLTKVTWTVVHQYETVIPTSWWEKFDGHLGATGDGGMDGILADLEDEVTADVIERNVDEAEDVS